MSKTDEMKAAAERRFPDDFSHEGDRYASRLNFIQGAAWQASRKVEVTDAMVEKAAQSLCNGNLHEYPHTESDRDRYRTIAHAALTAAMGGGE